MAYRSGIGLFATVVVAAMAGGTVGSLGSVNSLLVDSPWITASLATLGVVVAVLLALVILARPNRRSIGSPYW